MASRWPLLIQTSLSGEIRSWRLLPSPWLVSRATRRITILHLDIKHTSKFFFPDAWSFHAITITRFFIYRSAYLLFNSIIIQLGLQNLSATLRFSSETIRDIVIKLKHNTSRLQPDQHRRAFIDSALNWEVFHWTKRTLWLFVIKKFCHSSLNRPLSILIACLVYI